MYYSTRRRSLARDVLAGSTSASSGFTSPENRNIIFPAWGALTAAFLPRTAQAGATTERYSLFPAASSFRRGLARWIAKTAEPPNCNQVLESSRAFHRARGQRSGADSGVRRHRRRRGTAQAVSVGGCAWPATVHAPGTVHGSAIDSG